MFTTQSHRADGTIVVELAGKMMGGSEAVPFHTLVKDAVESGCNSAVIDMTNVDWLNSWGVGQLVSIYTTLKHRGGHLILSGCSPKVMTVLKLTKFDSVFSFEQDVAAAVAACRTQAP